MLNKFKQFFKQRNKDVLILMTGTVISQAVPLFATFVLTRLYTEVEFGLFQVYFSISMILSVAVTFRYEMAIMLPEKEEDARHILILSCLISVLFSFSVFVAVLFFRNEFSLWLKQPNLKDSFFILPFTLLIIGIYQSFNYWSNRLKYYKQLSLSRVARSMNSSILSIVFGMTSFFKHLGLIIGDTIGQTTSALFLVWKVLKLHPNLFKDVNWNKLKQVAIRYKKFPLFNVPSGFLEKLSGNLPALLMTPFFGIGVVGFFSLSQRMISLPGSVVARAMGDVFRQSATEAYNKDKNCKSLFIKTFKKLVVISLPPFFIMFFVVQEVFVFAFGENWREAGVYAQILMPMFLLQFIGSPLSNMFLVTEKQKIDFLLQICLFLCIILSIYLGYYYFDGPRETLMLYCSVYSLKYVVELLLSYKFSKGTNYGTR